MVITLDVPTISICIITYNRARYIEKTLKDLEGLSALPFTWEVLVSDNCSTDDTPQIVQNYAACMDNLIYLRQEKNVGAANNFFNVVHHARGKYLVYLADDDELVIAGLIQIIEKMEQNPDVVASYTPWDLWDHVDGKSYGLFYDLKDEYYFDKNTALDCFNLLVSRGIFPEIAIYRRLPFLRILRNPPNCYWAFVNVVRLLEQGRVCLQPTVFYRSVVRHWAGENRGQEGHKQAMVGWDLYRGGVEFFLLKALAFQGINTMSDEMRGIATTLIDRFVQGRMRVALNVLVDSRQFTAAYDLYSRLRLWGALPQDKTGPFGQQLLLHASIQSFTELADAMTSVNAIGLYQVSDVNLIRLLITHSQCQLPVTDVSLEAVFPAGEMLILAGAIAAKQMLVEHGYHDGLIVVESELAALYL